MRRYRSLRRWHRLLAESGRVALCILVRFKVVVDVESGTAFLTGRGSAGVHLPSEGRAHAVSQEEKAPVALAPLVEDSVLDEVEVLCASSVRGPHLTRVVELG